MRQTTFIAGPGERGTIMEATRSFDHIIVGGGVAADKAARAIREVDPGAAVAIFSDIDDGPLYRPGLSKDLWLKDDATLESLDLGTTDTGAELMLGVEVTGIDPGAHTIITADDARVGYRTLLLATGARPRTIDAPADDRIIYYRSADDYRQLQAKIAEGTRVAVVGGGYISSELAAGLTTAGASVTALFPGERMLSHMFPDSITGHLTDAYERRGVTLRGGFFLDSIQAGEQVILTPRTGDPVSADVVVLGLGAVPNIHLAEDAGLEIAAGGVLVNPMLATSAPDIYAAGDIATYEDPLLGRRRVEHIDQAEQSGAAAGRAMAGAGEEYRYTPLFYSDLFDDGYEAVGEVRTDHEVLEVWNDAGNAAVLSYLDHGVVRGVLLWNTWDSVPKAREMMAESRNGTLSEEELRGRITPGG